MRAKEYLGQAYKLNLKIENKLEQLAHLKALSERITTSFSSQKVSASKNKSPMESAIVKLVMLENRINDLIDKYIDTKEQIANNIDRLENHDHRMVLEARYLCFNGWDEIAGKLHYTESYVHKLHNKALATMQRVLSEEDRYDS